MLKNYLIVAYRHMVRQRPYTVINILGLSIGIACSLMIGIYVAYEFSYDKFNHNIDNMYRVYMNASLSNIKFSGPASPGSLAETMMHEFPQIQTTARIINANNQKIESENQSNDEDLFFYTDPTITDIFTFKYLFGNKEALKTPGSILITKVIALKYFGNSNPIGKTLHAEHENYTITAVTEGFPANSHFHFNFLATTLGNPSFVNNNWISNFVYTYVLLRPGADPIAINNKFPEIFQRQLPAFILHLLFDKENKSTEQHNYLTYSLQKVKDIHLKSNKDFELEANDSMNSVKIFIVLAFFILINACINFTNLSTARYATRAKEVGLRKVIGSSRMSLIFQFLTESFLICSISVILSFLIIEISLPHFSALVGHDCIITQSQLFHLYLLFPVFVFFIGIISGCYPAFYLSSFQPNDILKNKINNSGSGSYLKNTLVVIQYSVSIFIIIGTLIVSTQLKFIQNKKLGYDKENLLIIEKTNPIATQIEAFLNEIKKDTLIQSVCLTGNVPGKFTSENGYSSEGNLHHDPILMSDFNVDEYYLPALGITLTQGRLFKSYYPPDSSAVLINETAAQVIGIKNIIGKRIIRPGQNQIRQYFTVIGIIQDFNFESLYKPISPLILHPNSTYYPGYIIVRIKPGQHENVVTHLQHLWKKYSPTSKLQYYFMSDDFNKIYKNEVETQKILTAFSIISIFISILGLLGLVSFMTEKRSKEIGIRKVLGSSVTEIVLLLSKNITLLVISSFFIASIAIYLFSGYWLKQFAYHIDVSPWIYIAGGAVALFVTWFTVGIQTIIAAFKNPADSLQNE